jgi:hypothetical protein
VAPASEKADWLTKHKADRAPHPVAGTAVDTTHSTRPPGPVTLFKAAPKFRAPRNPPFAIARKQIADFKLARKFDDNDKIIG